MKQSASSHEPMPTANATAATVAVVYVVCATAITLAPELSMTIAQSWFHGIELSSISSWNMTTGSLILGFVTSVFGGWLLGYVFATAYNYFAKR